MSLCCMVSRDCSIFVDFSRLFDNVLPYRSAATLNIVVMQLANKVNMRSISCTYFTLCIEMCMFSADDVISYAMISCE